AGCLFTLTLEWSPCSVKWPSFAGIVAISLKEIRYLAKKILVCGVPALERDLMLALEQEHSETILVLLRQCVSRYAHLLGQGKTLGEVEAMLVAYCNPKELGEAVHETWEQEM